MVAMVAVNLFVDSKYNIDKNTKRRMNDKIQIEEKPQKKQILTRIPSTLNVSSFFFFFFFLQYKNVLDWLFYHAPTRLLRQCPRFGTI